MIRIVASQVRAHIASSPYGRILKVLLSPSLQKGLDALGMGMTTFPPGSRSNPHSHEESQEVWYVVSGEGEILVGEERARLEPDVVVVASPGLQHQLTNTGKEDLKVVWIFIPPGPEEEFIME